MLNIAQLGLMQSFSGEALHPNVVAWRNKGAALMYTLPTQTVLIALSDFMNNLGSGLVSRMKTGYIMHAGSKEMGSLNLKDPNTYQTSLVNSPTFLEGNGMKSNGTSSYIDQPFKSNEFVGIESNLTVIQYVSESSAVAGILAAHGMDCGGAGADAVRLVLYTFEGTVGKVDHFVKLANRLSFVSSNHKGLYVHVNGGIGIGIYKDGTKTSNATVPSPPLISLNRYILAFNSAATPIQFYTKYVACDFLFDAFNDADELAFRNAFNTYKTAIGLP